MANYSNVDGAKVSTWGPSSEVAEPIEEFDAEVEEMYFSHGTLEISLIHSDEETVTNILIPIKAKDSWNEFVESLPTWE